MSLRNRLRSNRRLVRAVLFAGVLAGLIFAGYGWATYALSDAPPIPRDAGETDGSTVIATQQGKLLFYGPNGTLSHVDAYRDHYFDIDPLPEYESSLLVVFTDRISDERCMDEKTCYLVGFERYNYSTGEREVIHTRVQYRDKSARWHDVDKLPNGEFAVVDITNDALFTYNATTDMITWEYRISRDFPLDEGNDNPEDWTHVNDVEYVGNDTYMLDLRNQDTVAFVHEKKGNLEEWQLGENANTSVLNQQHNPDYIPEENGGPAVIVADSQNNRIVEYQRVNGSWKQSWVWKDAKMAWPRDADRLPDGDTLITDTNSDRVLEVAPNGTVVWQVQIDSAYEAERLGTGDESAGGPSATRAGLEDRHASSSSASGAALVVVRTIFPAKLVNALKFVTPVWMGVFEVGGLFAAGGGLIVWIGFEALISPFRLRLPVARHDD